MSNSVTCTTVCPVCKKAIKINKETIRFGENAYSHIHLYYKDLSILEINKEAIHTYAPCNVNKPWGQTFEAFPLFYEKLTKFLTETAVDIQNYRDNSPEIRYITGKFLAVKRMCLASNTNYNKKMQTFFTEKLKKCKSI
jgi:hypothetical protein